MKNTCLITILAMLLSSCTPTAKSDCTFVDEMAWWQEARYGMFVHWGLSSLTGQEISWSRNDYGAERYDALAERFNPVSFDADKWIDVAEAAGMKYIVVTVKHHDGFCLWDSKANPHNIMSTPYKKDICRQLADAAHRRGMGLGWYFSCREWSDANCCDTEKTSVYVRKMKEELVELLSNYGKVDLLWFDYDGWPGPAQPSEIVDLIRGLQPEIVFNNRLYPLTPDESHASVGDFGMYCTPEQFVGGYGSVPWETCTTMSSSRQWSIRYNDPPRPAEELVWETIGAAAGNGNMLMNVGPDSLGVIPAVYADRLAEVGSWIRAHDGILYGTHCGPWKPTGRYASTVKGKEVWLLLREGESIDLPYDKMLKIKSISTDSGDAVNFSVDGDRLHIDIPSDLKGKGNVALKVCLSRKYDASLDPFGTSGSVAYNKPSSASSALSMKYMHNPAAAFDDNDRTAWVVGRVEGDYPAGLYGVCENFASSPAILNAFQRDATLGVDLQEEKTVTRFYLNPRGRWESVSLEYKSGDGWVEAASALPFDSIFEGEISPASSCEWRLSLHGGSIGAGVYEMQLFEN